MKIRKTFRWRQHRWLGAVVCALSVGQFGCPGNTKQISGCQGNDQCPSGQICRSSDGQCVPPPTYAELTIVKSGDGSGRVTSMPAGIDCGTTCTANVEVGAKLTLVATPSPDSQVLSFSIGCSSMTTTCDLTPTSSEPIRVLVNFSLTGAPPPPALQNGAGFYWESPRPVGNRLNDAVVSAGELWAVGDAGTILRRSNGAFTLVASGTNRNLTINNTAAATTTITPTTIPTVGAGGCSPRTTRKSARCTCCSRSRC